MSNKTYKNYVGIIIREAMTNFIANGNPDELEFRLWLGERKHYYFARFENILSKNKYEDKMDIYVDLVAEVDKVKETTFKALKPLQPEAEIINLVNREN